MLTNTQSSELCCNLHLTVVLVALVALLAVALGAVALVALVALVAVALVNYTVTGTLQWPYVMTCRVSSPSFHVTAKQANS